MPCSMSPFMYRLECFLLKMTFLDYLSKYTTLICLLPEPSPTHSWLPLELPPPLLPSPPHLSHHQDLMILPLNLPLGCPLCYGPSIQSSVQALIAFYLPLGLLSSCTHSQVSLSWASGRWPEQHWNHKNGEALPALYPSSPSC